MKCPLDNHDLQMSERQGIEVDYCPQCRGVWLDRGELDKIIERNSSEVNRPIQKDDGYQRPSYREENKQYPQGKHKKENLLSELFDF